jgi:hypothetical protein
MAFFPDYMKCWPVCVRKDGKLFGIPCAFVIFEDGVSWCDDGVLQEGYCSHHPYHHLCGPVEIKEKAVICNGWSFEPADAWDTEAAKAWNWCTKQVTVWMSTHENYEYELRADRPIHP